MHYGKLVRQSYFTQEWTGKTGALPTKNEPFYLLDDRGEMEVETDLIARVRSPRGPRGRWHVFTTHGGRQYRFEEE